MKRKKNLNFFNVILKKPNLLLDVKQSTFYFSSKLFLNVYAKFLSTDFIFRFNFFKFFFFFPLFSIKNVSFFFFLSRNYLFDNSSALILDQLGLKNVLNLKNFFLFKKSSTNYFLTIFFSFFEFLKNFILIYLFFFKFFLTKNCY